MLFILSISPDILYLHRNFSFELSPYLLHLLFLGGVLLYNRDVFSIWIFHKRGYYSFYFSYLISIVIRSTFIWQPIAYKPKKSVPVFMMNSHSICHYAKFNKGSCHIYRYFLYKSEGKRYFGKSTNAIPVCASG